MVPNAIAAAGIPARCDQNLKGWMVKGPVPKRQFRRQTSAHRDQPEQDVTEV
jgi:hypothetical protein